MNLSGICQATEYYKDETKGGNTFGVYDVARQVKPEIEDLDVPQRVTSVHSKAQVKKAVDVMRRDTSLFRYLKFST